MATLITIACIVCGACEDECPTGAVSLGNGIFVVDPERCTECVGYSATRKCVDICPIDCCICDPQRIETEEELFARAKQIEGAEPVADALSAATSHFRPR
jgi:ferredoxin